MLNHAAISSYLYVNIVYISIDISIDIIIDIRYLSGVADDETGGGHVPSVRDHNLDIDIDICRYINLNILDISTVSNYSRPPCRPAPGRR